MEKKSKRPRKEHNPVPLLRPYNETKEREGQFYTKVWRECTECKGEGIFDPKETINDLCPICNGTGEEEFRMDIGVTGSNKNLNSRLHIGAGRHFWIHKP